MHPKLCEILAILVATICTRTTNAAPEIANGYIRRGGKVCPDGTAIATIETCKKAVGGDAVLEVRKILQGEEYPPGCFYNSLTKNILFNAGSGQGKLLLYRPICYSPETTKTTESPPTTTTTTTTAISQDSNETEGDGSSFLIVGIGVAALVVVAVILVVVIFVARAKCRNMNVDERPNQAASTASTAVIVDVDTRGDEGDETPLGSKSGVHPRPDTPSNTGWQNKFYGAMSVYSLPDVAIGVGGVNLAVGLDSRTFVTSNYRILYHIARLPEDCAELLLSVKKLVERYAKRHNIPDKTWKSFYQRMYAEALKHYESLQIENLGKAAEFIWTSAKALCEKEFCTILNEAIRLDDPIDMVHAAVFSRGLNTLRVQRTDDLSQKALEKKFPTNGISYRGSGFRDDVRCFFTKGKIYRIPGYLATSFSQATTDFFMHRVTGPRVLWTVKVDPRGAKSLNFRCKQASFVENTNLQGESEYLFAPYSVFTVKAVKWGKGTNPQHLITICASLDNLNESEELPLAPWY